MNDTMTYDMKCELAAADQGLSRVAEALTPDYDFGILNSGGYCMCLVVYAIGGAIVVTGWDTEPDHVHIGAYVGAAWVDGDEPREFAENVEHGDVFDTVGRMADMLCTESTR